MQVLVIDSNEVDRFIAQKILSRAHNCIVVPSLDEALGYIHNFEFDSIVISYKLEAFHESIADLNKLKVLIKPTTPVFALGSSLDSTILTQLLNGGFEKVIDKPITEDFHNH